MPFLIIIFSLALATSAHAEIYKCVTNGQTIFSQEPCAADAVIVAPEVFMPPPEDRAMQDKNQAAMAAMSRRIDRDYRLMVLERRIADSEAAIIHLMRERDRVDAELHAAYEQALSRDKKAIKSQITSSKREFSTSIEIEKDRRAQAKSEYSRLLRSKE